jgi:hypothetical protein
MNYEEEELLEIPKNRGLLLVIGNDESYLEFPKALKYLESLEKENPEQFGEAIEKFCSFNPNLEYFCIEVNKVKLGPTKTGTTISVSVYPRLISLEEICDKEKIDLSKATLALQMYLNGELEVEEVSEKIDLSIKTLVILAEYFESDNFDNPFEDL